VTGLLTVVALAFVLGMRHATDADHVIAVSTIVTRHRSMGGALRIGVAWGLGHTATILFLGCGIILLGWVIPPRVELSMELAVGVMLVGLGLANLGAPRGPASGASPYARIGSAFDGILGRLDAYQMARPALVGVVHGMAGSAAVALLVLATMPGPRWSIAYLVTFGVGTILGMTLMTAAIGLPLLHPRAGAGTLPRHIERATGALSLAFGLYLVYRVAFATGPV
jgi:high-affinity nickel-transport protein